MEFESSASVIAVLRLEVLPPPKLINFPLLLKASLEFYTSFRQSEWLFLLKHFEFVGGKYLGQEHGACILSKGFNPSVLQKQVRTTR